MSHFHHSKRSREWWSFSVFTPQARCDAKYHSSSAHATINLTRNCFSDSGGKRVPHKTTVSLIQQKGPVQSPGRSPGCDCRYCTFCSTGFFFSSFCFSPWNTWIAVHPPTLSLLISVMQHVKQEKTEHVLLLAPLRTMQGDVVMWESRATYCLLPSAQPCSQEEALPSKAACQSTKVSAAVSPGNVGEVFHWAHTFSTSGVCFRWACGAVSLLTYYYFY